MLNVTYINVEKVQRIFIGIPIGKLLQQDIDRLLVPLNPHSGNLRWVPANNRHMTLAFLGDIPVRDVEYLPGKLTRTYQKIKPFNVYLDKLERFPNSRGRIVALTGESSGPLHGLVVATRDMLQGCGLRFERKKFRPHVTLARVRKPKCPVPEFDCNVQLNIDVSTVVLYRSILTDSGSVYTALNTVELR